MADEAHDKHGEGEHGGGGHGGGGHGGGGHGGGGHEEGHEGAPEWLISFADNVALIMGFFVILLAMNMAKKTAGGIGGENKFPSEDSTSMIDFVIEIRKAFNRPIDPEGNDPKEAIFRRRLKERAMVGETVVPGPDGPKHDVQAPRPSDWFSVAGAVSFADGEATISDEAQATLQEIARKIRGSRLIIEVRGNVSAAEAMRDKERAMRLGYDRALAAAKVLAAGGVEWERMRVVSCGDNERMKPRAESRDEHRTNQRVEVVQTLETMPPDPYGQGNEQRGGGDGGGTGPVSSAGTSKAEMPGY